MLPVFSRAVLPVRFRAGDGARTRDIKLGRLALYQLSYSRSAFSLLEWPALSSGSTLTMVGEGFEPSKACAGRFTVCSRWPLGYPTGLTQNGLRRDDALISELTVGIEPTTFRLQGGCSAI